MHQAVADLCGKYSIYVICQKGGLLVALKQENVIARKTRISRMCKSFLIEE